MKIKVFLSFLLLMFYTLTNAQDTLRVNNYKEFSNYLYANIISKYPELSFLKYKKVSAGSKIYEDHKGLETDPIMNPIQYFSLINDLDISNCKNDPKINLLYLEGKLFESVNTYNIPLSLSFIEYSEYTNDALSNNYVQFYSNQLHDNCPNGYQSFQKKYMFASSPLNQVFKNNEISFIFNDDLFMTNLNVNSFSSMYVDFGDGNGYVVLEKGTPQTVIYPTSGDKIIKTKVNYNNTTYYSSSQITIQPAAQQYTTSGCTTQPLPPNRGPISIATNRLGTNVSGKYAVWYSPCNQTGKIRKPYIISGGFNPGNGKQLVPLNFNDITYNFNGTTITLPFTLGWRGTFYETYNGGYSASFSPVEASQCGAGSSNGNQYLDRLRDEGYDIIILMYDNGTDYAINNAALYMELIEQINAEKFNNHSYFENVVSGYSAGGIASRLALALLESNYKQGRGKNPHTKLWVSIESENQGANVPLGFQNLLIFQSDPGKILPTSGLGLNILQHDADIINQVAAYIAYSFNFNPTGKEIVKYSALMQGLNPTPERTSLLNIFNSIAGNQMNGYPELCRRVGVSQGSSLGIQTPHSSSDLFNSDLKLDLLGNSYQYTTACGDVRTGFRPNTEKSTVARYWGTNNSQNIFDGKVIHDTRWTITEETCATWSILGFSGCSCFPAIEVGNLVLLIEQHNAKPNTTTNYDDVPASELDCQGQLYNNSAYGFYNNTLAGNSHAHYDIKLPAFAPTVSSLDIHDPNNPSNQLNNFTSVSSLNLMKINPNTMEPNSRFGFPYLNYPNNHYSITPYDAIYGIGNNNGTYSDGSTPKPPNQYHVEDPQSMIGDYLARVEVAPEDLFLSNRTIAHAPVIGFSYYPAEFEARNKIIVGKNDDSGMNSIYSKYANQYYLTPDGDFSVIDDSKLYLHCGEQIELLPGFSVNNGSELSAFILPYGCSNNLRSATAETPSYGQSNLNEEVDKNKILNLANSELLKIYPNPGNGHFTIELNNSDSRISFEIKNIFGEMILSYEATDQSKTTFDLTAFPKGIYFLSTIVENQKIIKKIILE